MRELTVRIRFVRHSLGNAKAKDGRFLMPRNRRGAVVFLATWHKANMRFAAQVLGRRQDEVGKVLWDIQVDGHIKRDGLYKNVYSSHRRVCDGSAAPDKPQPGSRQRYTLHEAFVPGQVIGINCVVPAGIDDDDFWRLMELAGRYKGLSPWRPGEFGFFEVESIRRRRGVPAEEKEEETPGPPSVAGQERS